MTKMPLTFVLRGLGFGVRETFLDRVFNDVILDHIIDMNYLFHLSGLHADSLTTRS